MQHYFPILALVIACQSLSATAQTDAPDAQSVTVARLADVLTSETKTTSAQVVALNRAVLAAEVSGRISSVLIGAGDPVRKGQVLIQIDKTTYALAVRAALARLASVDAEIERAEIQLQRVQTLEKKSYASNDEVLILETSLSVLIRTREQVKVDIEAARYDLERTSLRASVDGTIEERPAQLGAYVSPGTPLVTLTQTSDRQVAASVDPALVQGLSNSNRLQFFTNGVALDLKLLRISDIIDLNTRMHAVRFEFADEVLPVGTLGELRWQPDAGLIPADLVVNRNGVLGIFVAEDSRARFYALENAVPGRPANQSLPEDTRVVVGGRLRLQDGDKLSIVQQ